MEVDSPSLVDESQKSQSKSKDQWVAFKMHGTWRFLHKCGCYLLPCIKITSLSLFLIYVAIPIFVRANQWILPKIVFSNLIHWPPFVNLSHPSDFGLNLTSNFYLHIEDGVDIGVWHILPSELQNRPDVPLEKFEDTLASGHNIFLYLHGNSGTRGSYHRVQLYKILSGLNFHVVTIDYRGYGDSSGSPTENGVVADAYFTYKWIKQRAGQSKIFIWGHSLGTGVTTKLAKKICEEDEGEHPGGIVLESPFNNIRDAAKHHPLGLPYHMLPWFEWVFVDGIRDHGIFFSSDENILSITPNILILHAKDDYIVPFDLGKKLYHKAKETRNHKTGNVEFVTFEAHMGYGHKMIYKAPELPDVIKTFVFQNK